MVRTSEAQQGVKIHPVNSSAVVAIGYRGLTKELSVFFTSNPEVEYIYVNVPLFIVGAIFKSRSKGKALNRWVVDKVEYKKVMKEEATRA